MYSVKNFIKKNCTDTYDLDDMTDFADKICEDSTGRYTSSSAIKILCKYAYAKNGRIEFNVDARNFDQTIDDLKKSLTSNSSPKTPNKQIAQAKTPTPIAKTTTAGVIKSSLPTARVIKSSLPTAKPQNVKSNNQPVKPAIKRGGFGNLSGARNIVKSSGSDEEEDQPNKNVPSIKSHSSSVKSIKDVKDSNSKSKPSIKTKTKSESNDSESIGSTSNSTSTERSRNTSLFSSASNNSNGSTGSIKPPAIKTVAKSTSTVISTGTAPKRGGFGVFKKTLVKNNDNEENDTKSKSIKKIKNDGPNYNIPTEVKFQGVKRTDNKYGPYGTDSYHDTDIDDDEITDEIQRRVEVYRMLDAKYYPPQRSKEWFDMRNTMITASDGGTIVKLNPYEYDFGFVEKKVFGKPFETSIDCYHGKMFEQSATMIYEYRMNVKVKEFGLCKHPEYDFLGASPDGIVSEYKLQTRDGRTWEEIEKEANMIEDAEDRREYIEKFAFKTEFVGRMLEIKCPYRRKILMGENDPIVYGVYGEPITNLKIDSKLGVTPSYYFIQVQLQLQCCELDFCDFWQCEIHQFPDREDFIEDTDPVYPWLSRQTGHEKGLIIQIMPIDQVNNKSVPYYDRIHNFANWVYPPRIDMTPFELDAWVITTLQNLHTTHKGFVFESIKYWKLITSRNVTIARDDKWFADNLETFRKAWSYVEYFRANKDKAQLLRRYINTFPKDCYKKVKEPPKEKGIIMKTLVTLATEPDDKDIRNQKLYARFIAQLEQKIIDSGVEDPKDYDVDEDVEFIKESLELNIPDDMDLDDEQKEEYTKKHVEFVKAMKNQVQNYLFQEKDDIFD